MFQLLNSALEKQRKAITRIVKIVDGLRSFSRLDTSAEEIIDTERAIEDTLALIESIYAKENIIIEKKFAASFSKVNANLGKLQQVLMNLLVNAKDAMLEKGGGKITITTQSKSSKLQ